MYMSIKNLNLKNNLNLKILSEKDGSFPVTHAGNFFVTNTEFDFDLLFTGSIGPKYMAVLWTGAYYLCIFDVRWQCMKSGHDK